MCGFDGMCVLLAIDELVVAVVPRGGESASSTRELDANFKLVDDSRAVIKRLVYTDDPVVALCVGSFEGYFAPPARPDSSSLHGA